MLKLFQSILSFFTDDFATAGMVIAWVAVLALVHRYAAASPIQPLLFLIGLLAVLCYSVFRRTR